MNLEDLKTAMSQAGCVRLYAKTLAPNDNSKNQIYLGGTVESLQILHPSSIECDNSKTKGPTFKGKLDMGWLLDSGVVAPAPNAQLILYSQYPEVRLSAVLAGRGNGASARTRELICSRTPGRILFLGTTPTGKVVAYLADPDSDLAKAFGQAETHQTGTALFQLHLPGDAASGNDSDTLLQELRRIHHTGWIKSKQLGAHGVLKDCNSQHCGGYTLEAELGIAKNGRPEADFDGWEVKSYSVKNFDRPFSAGAITLFTPEPNGGFYGREGYKEFVRKFGYPAKSGEVDRLNFGGIYKVGEWHHTTGLSLQLTGFDLNTSLISDANGSIDLVTPVGEVAASWSFATVLEHWSRKHSRAAYVPTQKRDDPAREYQYGHIVCLARQGDPQRLLAALAGGFVYYDPLVKLLNASSATARGKPRSQFRTKPKDLSAIYSSFEEVRLID